jgi:hypothetical protein
MEMHTIFLLENLKRRSHSEYLGIDGWIVFEGSSGKQRGKVWIECIWFKIGGSNRLL